MFWNVTVEKTIEVSAGKFKKAKQSYLVSAETISEVEIKIATELEKEEYEIKVVQNSKIVKVLK